MIIEDGTGRGYSGKVDGYNRLHTVSISKSLEFTTSYEDGAHYCILAEVSSIGSGQNNILYLKNTSSLYDIIISNIRIQSIGLSGGTAVPSVNTYIELFKNATYLSGGSPLTANNCNFGSSYNAGITAYHENPTFSSNGDIIFKRYVQSDAELIMCDFKNSIVLARNDNISASIITDHTSGSVLCEIDFLLIKEEN